MFGWLGKVINEGDGLGIKIACIFMLKGLEFVDILIKELKKT